MSLTSNNIVHPKQVQFEKEKIAFFSFSSFVFCSKIKLKTSWVAFIFDIENWKSQSGKDELVWQNKNILKNKMTKSFIIVFICAMSSTCFSAASEVVPPLSSIEAELASQGLTSMKMTNFLSFCQIFIFQPPYRNVAGSRVSSSILLSAFVLVLITW